MASAATLNEPWCIAWLSHFLGHHAPACVTSAPPAAPCTTSCWPWHRDAGAARDGATNLGIVLNFETSHPADTTAEAEQAAETQDAIYNQWFIRALMGRDTRTPRWPGSGRICPTAGRMTWT